MRQSNSYGRIFENIFILLSLRFFLGFCTFSKRTDYSEQSHAFGIIINGQLSILNFNYLL